MLDFARLFEPIVWAPAPPIIRNVFYDGVFPMRIGGAFLLVAGLLLCLTIVWAAVGFLMMGFGLLCFLVAERRQKRKATLKTSVRRYSAEADRRKEPELLPAREATQRTALPEASDAQHEPNFFAGAADGTPPKSPQPPAALSHTPKVRQDPVVGAEPLDAAASAPPSTLPKRRAARRQVATNAQTYDVEKWRSIAKDDVDISRSVETLSPFGKKYVDLLASAYMAFNDKSYLPAIMKMVAEAIRKDSGRALAGAPTDGDAKMDLISFAMSKARGSAVDSLLVSAATATSPIGEAYSRADTGDVLREVEPKAEDNPQGSKPAPRHGVAKQSDTSPAAKPAVRQANPRPVDQTDANETRDLTDLFNKIA
jgi:hypothetical protein